MPNHSSNAVRADRNGALRLPGVPPRVRPEGTFSFKAEVTAPSGRTVRVAFEVSADETTEAATTAPRPTMPTARKTPVEAARPQTPRRTRPRVEIAQHQAAEARLRRQTAA